MSSSCERVGIRKREETRVCVIPELFGARVLRVTGFLLFSHGFLRKTFTGSPLLNINIILRTEDGRELLASLCLVSSNELEGEERSTLGLVMTFLRGEEKRKEYSRPRYAALGRRREERSTLGLVVTSVRGSINEEKRGVL